MHPFEKFNTKSSIHQRHYCKEPIFILHGKDVGDKWKISIEKSRTPKLYTDKKWDEERNF